MAKMPQITVDDVLREFAMDFEPETGVLQQYLTRYPEHSLALVDLSRELMREFEDETPLSATELDFVAAGMARLRVETAAVQSLQELPTKAFTEAVKGLALPMQVGLAFRERRIDVATLPKMVLAKLADALRTSTETLLSYLALPPEAPLARARKSSVKPGSPEKVSFERVLRDAGVEEQRILGLLREE